MPIRFTLVADGTSDKALVPVIEWTLRGIPRIVAAGFSVEFSTGSAIPTQQRGLVGRIDSALREFPCDLLFVHRDAEGEPRQNRMNEIHAAIEELDQQAAARVIPVIPVRMTEAWLLIDERALRTAADNPNGNVALDMPPLRRLEALPDPKQLCDTLLLKASGKTGRRHKKLSRPSELAWRRSRLAHLISDFSPLLELSAFRQVHIETHSACESLPVP